MSTRCQVKVWIGNDNVLSYYHHSGGWPSNIVTNLIGIAHKVKDITSIGIAKVFRRLPEYREEDNSIVHRDIEYVYHLVFIYGTCVIIWDKCPCFSRRIRKMLSFPLMCKYFRHVDLSKKFFCHRKKRVQELFM